MFITAFTPNEQVFRPHSWAAACQSDPGQFLDRFSVQPVGYWLLNSVITATAISVGKMVIAIPAAFAFAHFRFRVATGCSGWWSAP